MSAAVAIDMSLYEAPDEKIGKGALNLRAPDALRAMLNDTVKLWKKLAIARGEPQDVVDAIDLTYVCVRLLKVGADQAFGEMGVRLIAPEGEYKGLYRRAFPSGEVDENKKPVLTVVSPVEWKLVDKAVASTVRARTRAQEILAGTGTRRAGR